MKEGYKSDLFLSGFLAAETLLMILLLLALTSAFASRVGVARIEWRQSFSFSPASNLVWDPPQTGVRETFWEFVVGVEAYIYFGWKYSYLLGRVSEVPIASWIVVAKII